MTFQLEGGYIPNSRGLEEKYTKLHAAYWGGGKGVGSCKPQKYLGYLGFQNTLKVY